MLMTRILRSTCRLPLAIASLWQLPLFGNRLPLATDSLWQPPPFGNHLHLATAFFWQVEMVEALGNIQLAGRALADPSDAPTLHPVDARYAELRTQLTPIERNSSMHQLLQNYLRNTHGATHSSYSLQLEQAFEVAREGEADAFRWR